MALTWESRFETGVVSIDRQHQKLFEYINRLEEFINLGVYEGTEIDDLFRFLTDYVVMHFSHEEFCMKQSACPVAEKNKQAHDMFIKYFDDFKRDYKDSNSEYKKVLVTKLQQVAEDWITNHICKIDVKMRDTN